MGISQWDFIYHLAIVNNGTMMFKYLSLCFQFCGVYTQKENSWMIWNRGSSKMHIFIVQ